MRTSLYVWNIVLGTPHEAFFMFLIFILGGQLGATPFQLMIMACLKPISSFFSFFICTLLDYHPHRVRSFLIFNLLAGCLPCFLFLWADDVWFYITAYFLVMISSRAAYPVWIEYLKRENERQEMSRIVARGGAIEYGIQTIAPTMMAFCLDWDPHLWRWMFLVAAILKLSSIGLIFRVKQNSKPLTCGTTPVNFNTLISVPLIKGLDILKKKPQFARYLLIFFIGGAGVIGTQSILPLYFKQELHLSYSELAMAFSFCKGISFIAASPLWAKIVNRNSLFVVNIIMNFLSCSFFAFLIASSGLAYLVFPAYLFYGTMQAGCKLSWNMSGAVFSDDEDSTFYSSMNLALVGIRGILCPWLGYLLFTVTNACTVFSLAFILCFTGILYGLYVELVQKKARNPDPYPNSLEDPDCYQNLLIKAFLKFRCVGLIRRQG